MQATLGISPAFKHSKPEEKCPFCPGEEEKPWTTYPGAKNNSSTLEKNMENPERNDFAQSKGARKKDGKERRQDKDEPRKKPMAIYTDSTYGVLVVRLIMQSVEKKYWMVSQLKSY